jgi:hypothetical protein
MPLLTLLIMSNFISVTHSYRKQLLIYMIRLKDKTNKSSFEHEHLANVREEYKSLLEANQRGLLLEHKMTKSDRVRRRNRVDWLKTWNPSTCGMPTSTLKLRKNRGEILEYE